MLLFATAGTSGEGGTQSVIGGIFAPMQEGLYNFTASIGDFFSNLFSTTDLDKENLAVSYTHLGLGIASKKLAVKTDPRVEQVREYLPGANCGGCGFPGCDGLAAALVEGTAAPGACSACSKENLDKIGEILGVAVQAGEKMVARVLCRGDHGACKDKAAYDGVMDCKAAILVAGGFKMCRVGCLGLGTCARVCPFGAIKIGENGIRCV